MINHLKGIVTERRPESVVIECAGIGFKVVVTSSMFQLLPENDNPAMILTHLQMRDGGGDLFGFSSEEEREIFYSLTGVAGVGPKSGMAVLSVLGADGVVAAALKGDAKLFASVPGIGKKLAQRMVSELPDRLKKYAHAGQDIGGLSRQVSRDSSIAGDAVDALVSLGFQRIDAHNAVVHICRTTDANIGSEQLIKSALAHLYANSRAVNR